MKYLLTLLVFSYLSFSVYAQDCSSAEDCLQKGINNNFSNQSIEILTKAIKLAKKEKINQAPYYFHRGVKWYNKGAGGFYKDAMKDFKAAVKADPNYYPGYAWVGKVVAYKEKDYDKAVSYFNQVVEKFPNNPQAYYDRGKVYDYNNQVSSALKDFETAYNMLMMVMDGAEDMSTFVKGDICRSYAIAYMKSKNIYVYDQKTVEILETGVQLAPESPILLGELAMAYYDTDQFSKAETTGSLARSKDQKTYNSRNVGGNFLYGIAQYQKKSYFDAASYCGYADANLAHPHPLVYYFMAVTAWEYYLSIFDSNPNGWRDHEYQIKGRLELAAKYAEGTKYQQYADAARKNLEQLNK